MTSDIDIRSLEGRVQLGQIVQRWRRWRNFTQEELAAAAGVKGKVTISRIERGQMRALKPSLVEALARGLDIPTDYLMKLNPPPSKGVPRATRGPVLPQSPLEQAIDRLRDEFLREVRELRSDLTYHFDEIKSIVETVESTHVSPRPMSPEPSAYSGSSGGRIIHFPNGVDNFATGGEPIGPDNLAQGVEALDEALRRLSRKVDSGTLEGLNRARHLAAPSSHEEEQEQIDQSSQASMVRVTRATMSLDQALSYMIGGKTPRPLMHDSPESDESFVVVSYGGRIRTFAERSAGLVQALARYEELPGTRCLQLDGISESLVPLDIQKRRAYWLVANGRISQSERDAVVWAMTDRQVALERNLQLMRHDVFDVCPKAAIHRLADEGIPSLDDYFLQRGGLPLTYAERAEVLQNVVKYLDSFPTYRLGLVEDDVHWNAFWFVKEGQAVLLEELKEQGKRGKKQVEYEITDPGLVLLFRRYFFDRVWEKLPPENKDRLQVRSFLLAEYSRVLELQRMAEGEIGDLPYL